MLPRAAYSATIGLIIVQYTFFISSSDIPRRLNFDNSQVLRPKLRDNGGDLCFVNCDANIASYYYGRASRMATSFPILHGAATVETGTQRLSQDALTLIPFNFGEMIGGTQ